MQLQTLPDEETVDIRSRYFEYKERQEVIAEAAEREEEAKRLRGMTTMLSWLVIKH